MVKPSANNVIMPLVYVNDSYFDTLHKLYEDSKNLILAISHC